MPLIRIAIPHTDIAYEENTDPGSMHAYIAFVRSEDDSGGVVGVTAADEFVAGVLAKPHCKRVLYVCPVLSVIEALSKALAAEDAGG